MGGGKEGENREKEERSGRKGKNREGSFTYSLLKTTDWQYACVHKLRYPGPLHSRYDDIFPLL